LFLSNVAAIPELYTPLQQGAVYAATWFAIHQRTQERRRNMRPNIYLYFHSQCRKAQQSQDPQAHTMELTFTLCRLLVDLVRVTLSSRPLAFTPDANRTRVVQMSHTGDQPFRVDSLRVRWCAPVYGTVHTVLLIKPPGLGGRVCVRGSGARVPRVKTPSLYQPEFTRSHRRAFYTTKEYAVIRHMWLY